MISDFPGRFLPLDDPLGDFRKFLRLLQTRKHPRPGQNQSVYHFESAPSHSCFLQVKVKRRRSFAQPTLEGTLSRRYKAPMEIKPVPESDSDSEELPVKKAGRTKKKV